MTNRYLILERGSYDDYTVDILNIDNVTLNPKEILRLLNADSLEPYRITGQIDGQVTGWSCLDLLEEATKSINAMFCCFDNRPHKTVLNKKYTKEELLNIATANDNSGLLFWQREVERQYDEYSKCYDIYQKLLASATNQDTNGDKENE